MADAADLKSALRKGVWVRVPPSALLPKFIADNRTYRLLNGFGGQPVLLK
jgi:hypothetical protein